MKTNPNRVHRKSRVKHAALQAKTLGRRAVDLPDVQSSPGSDPLERWVPFVILSSETVAELVRDYLHPRLAAVVKRAAKELGLTLNEFFNNAAREMLDRAGIEVKEPT